MNSLAQGIMANYRSLEEQEKYAWERIPLAYEARNLIELKKAVFWLLKLQRLKIIQLENPKK